MYTIYSLMFLIKLYRFIIKKYIFINALHVQHFKYGYYLELTYIIHYLIVDYLKL